MICASTGKQSFDSRRDAKAARSRAHRLRKGSNQRGNLRAYRCTGCGFWHLGHIPREAVRKSRAEVFDGVKPLRRPRQKTHRSPTPPVVPPAAAVSRLIVMPAHEWFATRLCEAPRCGHEQPCPVHSERRAA